MEKKIGAGVIAIDTKTGQLLLAKRNPEAHEPNTWASFGGTYDEDDGNPKTTAKREFKEESGVEVPYKISKKPFYINDDNFLTFYNYIGLFDGKFDVLLDEENADFGWFNLNNLPEDLHPGFKEMIDNKKEDIADLIKQVAKKI